MQMRRLFWGLIALLMAGTVNAQPFTYQGFLKENGNPANGTFNMTFTLFNHPTNTGAGAQVGSPITLNNVPVQNGLFTVELNFGSTWDGSERWLEIQVGATTFSPRVKITPTPYAAFALRPWQTAGSAVFYNDGNVGIGTNAPAARLSLGGGNANTKLALWQGDTAADVMGFGIAPDQFRLHLHNPNNRFSFLDAPNGSELMTILGNGNVGIGLTSPTAKLHIRGGNLVVDGSGNVAIGTSSPESRLHVLAGSAGTMTAFPDSVLSLEHSTHAYLSILTPNGNERGILFGQPSSNVAGGIIYNNSATPNGLQFRTNGNTTRMVIDGSGNVGIGTSSPWYALHVQTSAGDRAIVGFHTATTGNVVGVFGTTSSTTGAGVYGFAPTTSGPNYGVYGRSDSTVGTGVYGEATAASWGVWGRTLGSYSYAYGVTGSEQGDTPGHAIYAQGTLAATGTKSFQIDHPLCPETHYLNHFCAEGPEPYNLYRGTVVLDARGEAWIQLPAYFEAINRDPSYHLTPIGAPMPNLHVAVKVQNNRFKIAGGAPGKEVSWEVKAIRNDRWVQEYGFKTEQEKEDEIKGKYLNPELYGQPKERGIHYRPEPAQPGEGEKPK